MSELDTNYLLETVGRVSNMNNRIVFLQNEITRLTAELADAKRINEGLRNQVLFASTEPDWTPITSVEQVEGLAAGFYELCHINEKTYFATRGRSGWLLNTLPPRFSTGSCSSDAVCSNFTSYKLIRAFAEEQPAPSIPEGAIENTLENRRKAQDGHYLFIYPAGDNLLFYKKESYKRHEAIWLWNGYEETDEKDVLSTARYFYPMPEKTMLAALEALAKGER